MSNADDRNKDMLEEGLVMYTIGPFFPGVFGSSAPSVEAPDIWIHIPHDGEVVPDEAWEKILISEEDFRRETLLLRDWYTRELFDLPRAEATQHVSRLNRLIFDPEREFLPENEPMEAVGMGMVYTKTTDGRALRETLTEQEEDDCKWAMLSEYRRCEYESLVPMLDRHERVLVIDAHSFPSSPLPCHEHLYDDRPVPDICIGRDVMSATPPELVDLAIEVYQDAGLTVSVDYPFSGSYFPAGCITIPKRCKTMMIEINRSLYMDESTGWKLPSFDDFAELNRSCLRRIIGGWHECNESWCGDTNDVEGSNADGC